MLSNVAKGQQQMCQFMKQSETDQPDQNTKGSPIDLNKDPSKVFSVVTQDGKPAIRISGETFGAVTTLVTFENYHLRLHFKWGTTS